jgi:hypothetical protein
MTKEISTDFFYRFGENESELWRANTIALLLSFYA